MAESLFYVGPDEISDKYRLKRQIGSGGEAQLWEAELNVSGTWEPVAVKVLRADHFDDFDRWKDRWGEQAEVLRFIRHPGVVGVREHFEGGGMHYAAEAPPGQRALYLVMNWHEGQTIREWSLQHRSAADGYEALRFLAQVGDVLDWLHSGQATPSGRPVIHADVTANNVLVTPAGQAVLVDFGLVRLAAGLSPEAAGTFGYVAPEVKALGAYSPASDRYAFGALTYFVLTGSPAPATIAEIRAGLAQVPAVVAQPTLLDHLLRMFDPDPQARPACGDWIRYFRVTGATSADVVGAGFTAPLDPTSIHTTTLPPPTPPAKPKRRKRAAIIAGIIAAVVLGSVIGVAALGGDGDGDDGDTSAQATDPPTGAATNTTDPADAVASTADTSAAAATVATTTTEPTSTTEPATTTTASTTTTTIPATTTTTVPRTTTTLAPTPRPVPTDAYTYGSGCGYSTSLKVQTVQVEGPNCHFYSGYADKELSLDINVSPRATRFTGRLVFADDTFPVETVGLVTMLLDGTPVLDGSITFAAPWLLDVDVTDKSRLTLRLRIHEDSLPNQRETRVVLMEPFFAS